MVGRWGTIEPLDQDSCRLTMTSTSLDWPTQAVGNVGAEFTVLGPPEFAAHLQEWGARFIRATRAPAPSSPWYRDVRGSGRGSGRRRREASLAAVTRPPRGVL
ncbi:hypothetical protein JNW89_04365 [Micromonospora sp. 4G55]|nr:hypothetical protein [Micromonospora sp. 4G55]